MTRIFNPVTDTDTNKFLNALGFNLTDGVLTATMNDSSTVTVDLDGRYQEQEAGKGLSANDFTDALETKLNGIAAGAEVNVNADWNSSSGDSQILNKPTDITNLGVHYVTECQDVLNAGSGSIITNIERNKLSNLEAGISITGNFGQFQSHTTYSDFNAEPSIWGWSFVMGNTNAPNSTSSQWYRLRTGLGSGYGKGTGSTDYWLEIAVPRYNAVSSGLMHMRWKDVSGVSSWVPVFSLSNYSVTDLSDVTNAGSGAIITAAERTKLTGIETNADVTDATNVNAAGAVMNSDTSTASMSFVIDEDNMSSDSETKVPTQQSVKAYVDANSGGGGTGYLSTFTQNDAQHIATEKIIARDSDGLKLFEAGGTGVFIKNGGSVGIGTTTPLTGVNIHNKTLHITNDDGIPIAAFYDDYDGGGINNLTLGVIYNAQDPYFVMNKVAGGTLDTSSNHFVMKNGGNIGINTNSPGERLEVNGTVKASEFKGATSSNNVINTDGASQWVIIQQDGNEVARFGGVVAGGTHMPFITLGGSVGADYYGCLITTALVLNSDLIFRDSGSGNTAAIEQLGSGYRFYALTGSGNANTCRFYQDTNQDSYIVSGKAAGYVLIQTDGTSTPFGKTGIGVNTPLFNCDIGSDAVSSPKPALNIASTTTGGSLQAKLSIGASTVTNGEPNNGFQLGTDSTANTSRDFFIYDSYKSLTRMLIDTDGKVGLGTTDPDARLHIYDTSTYTEIFMGENGATDKAAILKYLQGNGSGTGKLILGHWGDNLDVNGVGLTVKKGGSVGIGNNNPTDMLNVAGNISMGGTWASGAIKRFSALDNNSAKALLFQYDNNPGTLLKDNDSIWLEANGKASLKINNIGAVSTSANNYSFNQSYMAEGSLSIGSYQTDYGGLSTGGWNSNMAGLMLDCNDTTQIAVHDANHRVASFMRYNGNNFYMGGNKGWGTSKFVFGSDTAPTYTLEAHSDILAKSINSDGTYIGLFKGLGSLPGYASYRYPTLKTDYSCLYFAAGNTYTGYICYNTGFVDVSDARKKQNVKTIKGGLDKINKLRGVTFEWNDGRDDYVEHVGVIAQEVQEVLPEIVSDPTGTDMGVNYGSISSVCIEAIKELTKRVEKLEAMAA